MVAMVPVTSWGRLGYALHDVVPLLDRRQVGSQIRRQPQQATGLAYGMGRSYGDVCLNPDGRLWPGTGLNHLIAFDQNTGRLVCEAGVLLRDIQTSMVPRGWMLPVTPGTQLVTVGGAIANDVHGKNHHVMGSFGDHVVSLTLLRTDGQVLNCSANEHANWLAATIGGMGLTGVVVQAELQLRQVPGPWLETETLPYASLDAFFALADASETGWEYTVSWIDCLNRSGRGVFMRANHTAKQGGKMPPGNQRSMPFAPPVSLVNRASLRPFNLAYFYLNKWRAGRTGHTITHYEPFFYPLDNLLEWNRMYGKPGFYQYQSVVPRAGGAQAVAAMLAAIARSGQGSFLAVLKTFGDRVAPGMLSFPRPGVTLALDFPNHGAATAKLFLELDAIVKDAGGRIYPAKDARMPRELFEAGYARLTEFLPYRDPGISSALARRLMGF